VLFALVGNVTAAGLYQWSTARQRASEIKSLFGRYVSRNVVDIMLTDDIPIELDSHKSEITVLFSDIRNFTTLSEQLSPVDVGRFLNGYFEEMIDAVFMYSGTLDKLMGDAVMAFFGAPLPFEGHPDAACRCAVEMVERLELIREAGILPRNIPLDIGVGINTGEVIVGNLGSSAYFDYTVIGDTVNLTSRLESLNKLYGTNIIIGETTFAAVRDDLICRELDCVRVKGKDEPTRIYEVKSYETPAGFFEVSSHYGAALEYYRQADWARAIRSLEQALGVMPEDGPSRLLMRRCRQYLQQPPEAPWDGVTHFQTK
jgi:adenylate cyclase